MRSTTATPFTSIPFIMMCGGIGATKEADEEIQAVCNQMKAAVEQKCSKSYTEFTAKQYATQVVAGMNYFIKVHVGDDKHIHIRAYKPLPGQGDLQLINVLEGKTETDPITYF